MNYVLRFSNPKKTLIMDFSFKVHNFQLHLISKKNYKNYLILM